MWIEDFFSLVYPRICICCGNSLWKSETVVCTLCEYRLPKTWYHLDPDNPVSRIFWGRVRVESAASYLHFNKGNRVQHLIHCLKYKGRKEVGIWLGSHYGNYLKHSPLFRSTDLIIPVPLHRNKELSRGFNQSEQFGIGLAASMQLPLEVRSLYRTRITETQTRKTRFKRWENVSGMFGIRDPARIAGKHLLLVDDVVTTGATLEACVHTLLTVPEVRISVATIATTRN
ncbi:MAG: ComF family protein [Bacteroidetes bacterium]|nr:MAG: ComF family protein [Bacteroidota bacterium]